MRDRKFDQIEGFFFVWNGVHVTIYGQEYSTVKWCVQAISQNMKVQERNIQNVGLICFL